MRPHKIGRLAEGLATLPPEGWADVTAPATGTKQGSNSKPDMDYENIGLLFPSNDTSEKIYISGDLSAGWDGSDGRTTAIFPFVRYLQESAAIPTFIMEYRFYNSGESFPAYTTISTDDGLGVVYPYTAGSILQMIAFQPIVLSGFGLKAGYDMIFYRDDNAVAGDVLVKSVGWRARFDALGSRTPLKK